jgi:ribosomal protein S18 acetylase RimI-like enzyme
VSAPEEYPVVHIVPPVRKAVEVDIRPLAESDLAALATELGRGHARYFRRRMPLQQTGRGMVLVAFHRAKPVGAVLVVWGEPAEERQLRLRLPGVPLLYHVHVKENLRCRGIGTQILAAVHDELRARGHQKVTLGVDQSNKDARRLYERLGYDVWTEDSWGTGDSKYQAMVLDLERNDRTEFLGAATGRHEIEPPPLGKAELNSVINEVLGATSQTPAAANAPVAALQKRKQQHGPRRTTAPDPVRTSRPVVASRVGWWRSLARIVLRRGRRACA